MLRGGDAANLSGLSRTHRTSDTPADSIGRWRRDTPETQALCQEVLGDLLVEFGYG